MKGTRKVRKTNDLLCFHSPAKENICPEDNVHNGHYQQSLSPITMAASYHDFEDDSTAKSVTVEKKKVKMIMRENTFTCSNFPLHEKDALNFGISKAELLLPETSSKNDETKKRKIVKAKRFFQNSQINEKIDKRELKKTQGEIKQDVALKSKNPCFNVNFENKSSIVAAEDSVFTEYTMQQTKREINTTHGTYSSTENQEERSNSPLNLVVKSLSSPVSPSLNSTGNLTSPQLEHLHFNSSEEELYPSTSGIVESSSRRRTYELEDSISNISVLKSASEKDSFRMNSSVADLDSVQCKTPSTEQNYSRVTVRRKWDKVNTFSTSEDGPAWSNSFIKSSSDEKIVNAQNLGEKVFPKERKASSTKKNVSKIKIPNFAVIHQKALSKVESIAEYKQRKEDRAQMLLSGRKPTVTASSSKEDKAPLEKKVKSVKKESRKHLRFAPETSAKEKSPTFIPLPSTPLPKHLMHKTEPFAVIQPFKFGSEKVAGSQFSKEIMKQLRYAPETSVKEKSPTFIPCPSTPLPKHFVHKKEPFIVIQPFKFGSEKVAAPHFPKEGKTCSHLKQKILEKKIFPLKNIEHVPKTFHSHHGSAKNKLDTMHTTNLKSIITKSKPTINTLESRRFAIKGVRSNRRFELLMNMRKGK